MHVILLGAMRWNDRRKYENQTRWTTVLTSFAEHEVNELKTVENLAKATKNDLYTMQETVNNNMKNDFGTMQSNFDLIRQHQNDMEKELNGMKDYQDEMKNDLNQMKRSMKKFLGGMEKEVSTMKEQSDKNFSGFVELMKDTKILTTELNLVKTDTQGNFDGIKRDNSALKSSISTMKRNITDQKGFVETQTNSLKKDLTQMKKESTANFLTLKKDNTKVEAIRKDLSSMNGEVNAMKTDIRTILNILKKQT